jgi:eukaryotic-like serine/threonine-protein kinase
MTLTPGTRIGPYEVTAAIGAGGMGEVYRAIDTNLGRPVAIKVLPEVFASDADRLARFEREAKTLAALNHPNIAQIYGLEKTGGIRALVLELVEGPTLADRIAQGPITVDEALPIAKQIAEALEAAHEQAIVHRDLKPANIKIRPDGTVKVLDFGLAKALEPMSVAGVDATASPTITSPAMMTGVGVLLGTAAYMSPEQARGKAADKRADIWAFGCVLYEMLTGRRAFEGEDAAQTLAFVMAREPEWTAVPASVPAPLRMLLTLCLEKDRGRRMTDIAVAQFLLSDKAGVSIARAPVPGLAPPFAWRRRLPWAIAGLVGVPLVATVAWWAPWRTPPFPQPVRFTIAPPAAQPFNLQGFYRNLAISPDGTRLVYVAGRGDVNEVTGSELMVRAIDQLEAVPLRGIATVAFPFISPDGRWVGFFSVVGAGSGVGGPGGDLKKISITGGPPQTLCQYHGTARGATWGPDDTIVFATNDPSTGLLSVPAGGGAPKVLTKPDAARGEQDHLFPSLLPGGRAVLFTISVAGGIENGQVAVLDLQTGQQKTLVRGGSDAQYVETGHLVYASAGTLRAVRFDPDRLEVLGDPVPVVERMTTLQTGAADFRISRQGTLVYVPGGSIAAGAMRSLVWVTREGREEPINAPPRTYASPRLSPDGTRVALDAFDQDNDIWIWDLGRETLTRLTFDPGADSSPNWAPDGRRIVFGSSRAGSIGSVTNLFWQAADGTGTPERLTTSPNTQAPQSFSPDGKRLVLGEANPKTANDLLLLQIDGTPRREPPSTSGNAIGNIHPLIQTTFQETAGEVSPDGRWLTYYSNESGRNEVYVRPFPNVDGGRWQISVGGGTRPAWSRNGRELFYLAPGPGVNELMMAVPVQTTPTFSAGNPSKLFEGPWYIGVEGRTYDVSPDGKRFLLIRDVSAQPSALPTITVVLNWFEELKRLVPAN